jgi:hypothetical protein
MPTDTLTLTRARALIESRLAELNAEAKDLERALASLGERPAPHRRRGRPKKAATPPAKAKRRTSRKRARRGQRAQQLLTAVKAIPGSGAAQLGKSIGISTNQAYALAAKLHTEGQLTKSGRGYRLASAKRATAAPPKPRKPQPKRTPAKKSATNARRPSTTKARRKKSPSKGPRRAASA